jgi:quinol-cytochrome oxidoreductase complex cytochrome b subunit
MSPNPAKAPWYFMGFQELLLHVHPVIAIVVVPAAGLLALLLLPYVTREERPAGWSWRSVRAAGVVCAAAFVLLTLVGVFFRGPGMSLVWPWAR